ncbi:MAG: PHP domain-containing protein [Oscillospiraceae bacterium]|nr:PHP domain-containing protein [Oscillospiraceae bacterium]
MLVDMHLHEKTFSHDSFLSMKEIVDIAKLRGLDAVCITDHDDMGMKDLVREYSEELEFPIFVGVEFFSLWGDITAWGIDTIPDHRIGAQDFIDHVNASGGFCVSCHPFRNNNRGLEDNLRRVRGLHGVEVLNGSASMEANRTALRYCRELGLKAIGGSDAHNTAQVAKYVTWLPETVTTLPDFVAQLRSRDTKPAIWNGSGFDIVDTF